MFPDRTSANISPTFGSKPTNGLIASLSTSVKESASARCAAMDKMDHHLECQANSEARCKCGSSELALYFARLPTHFKQFVLHLPPISHANVSNWTLPSACAASRYVLFLRFSATFAIQRAHLAIWDFSYTLKSKSLHTASAVSNAPVLTF